MSEHIQAIYEHGVLRPLSPLDLEENSVVEIDVRDAADPISEPSADVDKWLKNFHDWMNSLDPNTPVLTDEQISRESIYADDLDRHL